MATTYRTEEFKVSGDALIKQVKELIHQSNVRKITIKDNQGKTVAEFPLTFGVVGALIAPALAAIGAIAALMTECTIAVEREDEVEETKDVVKQ